MRPMGIRENWERTFARVLRYAGELGERFGESIANKHRGEVER